MKEPHLDLVRFTVVDTILYSSKRVRRRQKLETPLQQCTLCARI